MASTRRTQPLPLPGAELARLRDELPSTYGSQLWTDGANRILVVRVPRDDPDILADLEGAAEHVRPNDLEGTPTCLLVGHQRTHLVAAQVLLDLVTARIQADRRQADRLRKELAPGEFRTFKAPEDPHRLRLGIRLAKPTVRAFDDADLEDLARRLGPQAATAPVKDAKFVHLVADQDDVRLDAAGLLQEAAQRFAEEAERRRLAEEVAAKERAHRVAAAAPRAPPIVASAPLKRATPTRWDRDAMDPERAAMIAHLDSLPGPGRPASPRVPEPSSAAPGAPRGLDDVLARLTPGSVPRPTQPDPALAPSAPAAPVAAPIPPSLEAVRATLQRCGFAVAVRPPNRHGIDAAGERAAGYPQRVIAFTPERLTVDVAEAALAAARVVEADLALICCDVAEPEARKRLIATKARHVGLGDLAALRI